MGGNSQTDTHGSDGGLDGAEFLLQDDYLRLVQLPFDPGGITLCLWRRSGLPPPQLRALRGSGTEKGGARLNLRGTGQPNCGQACDWLFWKLKQLWSLASHMPIQRPQESSQEANKGKQIYLEGSSRVREIHAPQGMLQVHL